MADEHRPGAVSLAPIRQAAPATDRELCYLRCGGPDHAIELVIVRRDFQGVFTVTDKEALEMCATGTKVLAERRS